MEIILNITEDSKVELVKDNCEAVQGENNVTILNINWPSTIKGYSIDNYTKQIEFGECKEIGECKKFFDLVNGNTYKLCSICTQFKKLMIQFTLKNSIDEAEPIVWKTTPFALEFCESINAENTKEAQVALLSLVEIKAEWENYIKSNTLRMIYKVGDVPEASATSVGDTIFYLGANSTNPYLLTYGHYYRCNYLNGAYEWTDLTQDPSLEGVANGIREINHNQTMQLWVGTGEDLENEEIQDNVLYIPEDHDVKADFDDILTDMAEDQNYNLAYPITKNTDELLFEGKHIPLLDRNNNVLKFGEMTLRQTKLIWEGEAESVDLSTFNIQEGNAIEVIFEGGELLKLYPTNTTQSVSIPFVNCVSTRNAVLLIRYVFKYSLTNIACDTTNSYMNGLATNMNDDIDWVYGNYTNGTTSYKIKKIWLVIE